MGGKKKKKKKKANKHFEFKRSQETANSETNLFKRSTSFFQRPKPISIKDCICLYVCEASEETGQSARQRAEMPFVPVCEVTVQQAHACALYVCTLGPFLRPCIALNFQTITETLKLGKDITGIII